MGRRSMRSPVVWTTVGIAAGWIVGVAFLAAFALFAPAALKTPGELLLTVIVALVPLSAAIIINRRLPGHPASALLAAAGCVAVVTTSIREDFLGPFDGSWMLLYLPFALLLLILPTGRALNRRWRAAGWALTGIVFAFMAVVAAQALIPNASEITQLIGFILLGVFMLGLGMTASAPIVRYRRSGEHDRLQLRWVFLIGSTLPLTLLLCWTSYLIWQTPDLVGVGLVVIYLAFPLCIIAALLHPTFADVDRVLVNVVTSGLLAVGALVLLTLAGALSGIPLTRCPPLFAVAIGVAIAIAAAACFRTLHHTVDRVLYPERSRALTALTLLSRRVDQGLAAPEDIETVLREALRDPRLEVGFRRLEDGVLMRIDGSRLSPVLVQSPIRLRGEKVGAICTSPSRNKSPASAISKAAAPLVDAVRLRAALSRAVAEVAASRSRMLHIGYEERRRLERDLHDGAQQRLVALGMQLRVLQRTTAADAAMSASIDAAVAELGTAVAELRQLAHGVRPSSLDDGLATALSSLVRHAPHMIALDVRTPDLPDAVATTAYYVVSEAVANALKHARASRVHVTVRGEDGRLEITVRDDGAGGATFRAKGGLTGLSDRVETLGGTLSLDSTHDEGTTVRAVIPCAS